VAARRLASRARSAQGELGCVWAAGACDAGHACRGMVQAEHEAGSHVRRAALVPRGGALAWGSMGRARGGVD
jgi:hypothetical protein